MYGYWIETSEEADEFLSRHKTVRLNLKKTGDGWVAVYEDSQLRPLPHRAMHKKDLQLLLARRYLATVYDTCAFVNLEWVRRHPGWATDLGGLPEIARPILIRERTGLTQEVSDGK